MSARNLDGRRRYPLPRHVIVLRAVVVLALLALALWQFRADNRAPPAPHAPGAVALVQRAVDGDTLLLADHTRVRLLGGDQAEAEPPEAPVEPGRARSHDT